jgi:hypothetical protein
MFCDKKLRKNFSEKWLSEQIEENILGMFLKFGKNFWTKFVSKTDGQKIWISVRAQETRKGEKEGEAGGEWWI